MVENTDKRVKWATYYENHKRIWYDPTILLVVKTLIRLVELHRSDSKGWSLPIRKIAQFLNIAPNTALKAVNIALDNGYLEANKRIQRKRRKLRLSVSLRAPVENEIPSNSKLSQWEEQPVSPTKTDSVSPTEAVNIKPNIKANKEESQIKKEQEKPDSPLNEHGYLQALETRRRLFK